MKIHLWALFLLFIVFQPLLAQKYSYGLTPDINIPSVRNSTVAYSSNVGFGLGMYLDYKTILPQLKTSSSLYYGRTTYGVDGKNTKILTDNFGLKLGVKYAAKKLDNSSILVGLAVQHTAGATSIYSGINNTGPKEVNIAPKLDNRFAYILSTGLEFDLKSNLALVATYNYAINKAYLADFVDAQPNTLKIGLNIGLGEAYKENGARAEMLASLATLKTDTLYFINKSCEGEMTNNQLDSILKVTYFFSAYRVISDAEISKVQKQSNTQNFAIVGSHYASLDDIPSSGIFLLDKNLNNLTFPYPHFIRLEFDFGNTKKMCVYTLDNVAVLLFRLETELNAALN